MTSAAVSDLRSRLQRLTANLKSDPITSKIFSPDGKSPAPALAINNDSKSSTGAAGNAASPPRSCAATSFPPSLNIDQLNRENSNFIASGVLPASNSTPRPSSNHRHNSPLSSPPAGPSSTTAAASRMDSAPSSSSMPSVFLTGTLAPRPQKQCVKDIVNKYLKARHERLVEEGAALTSGGGNAAAPSSGGIIISGGSSSSRTPRGASSSAPSSRTASGHQRANIAVAPPSLPLPPAQQPQQTQPVLLLSRANTMPPVAPVPAAAPHAVASAGAASGGVGHSPEPVRPVPRRNNEPIVEQPHDPAPALPNAPEDRSASLTSPFLDVSGTVKQQASGSFGAYSEETMRVFERHAGSKGAAAVGAAHHGPGDGAPWTMTGDVYDATMPSTTPPHLWYQHHNRQSDDNLAGSGVNVAPAGGVGAGVSRFGAAHQLTRAAMQLPSPSQPAVTINLAPDDTIRLCSAMTWRHSHARLDALILSVAHSIAHDEKVSNKKK